MSSQRKRVVALLALLLAAATLAGEREVVTRVSYVAADGIYVDRGADAGLGEGDVGIVRRGGKEIARAEVVATAPSSARLRLVGPASLAPAAGDLVVFRLQEPEKGKGEEKPARPEPVHEKEFVPLLERQRRKEPKHRPNVSRGRVSLRQLIHVDGAGGLDYWTTVVGLHGGLDRISGTAWGLRWSGNLSTRGGDAFDGSSLDGARLDMYELSLSRALDGGGLFRVGRLQPLQLPAAGFLDGAEIERPFSGSLRLGAVLGFRPTRDDLTPSGDEPAALAYATFETERYLGTFGLLGGWFDGAFDRAALVMDQHLRLGEVRVGSSAEIDFDVGAGLRDGSRLTRADLHASARLGADLTLRTGLDHYEQLDNQAERAALGLDPATPVDDGFWRYWVGAGYAASDRLRLDGEVAILAGAGPRWRLSATRREVLGLEGSSLSLTVYNLESESASGWGGLVSGYVPLRGGRLTLSPSLGFRAVEDLQVTSFDVRADYRLSSRSTVHAAVSHAIGDGLDSTLVELGVTYRW